MDKFENDGYIKTMFNEYIVQKKDGMYLVEFYVYPKKEEYEKVKDFCKTKILERKFEFFHKNNLNNLNLDEYRYEYCDILRRKINILAKKLDKMYEENNFSQMYNIIAGIMKKHIRTTNILSSISYNKKIVNVVNNIKKILDNIITKSAKEEINYKNKNDSLFDDYYDEFDVLDENEYLLHNSKYFDDEDMEYDLSTAKNSIKRLKYEIRRLFNFYNLDLKKLMNIENSEFIKSLNTARFGDSVELVSKNVRKFNGYTEEVKRN